MSLKPKHFEGRTGEFLREARTVRISLIVRIITGILCIGAGAIMLYLTLDEWLRDDEIIVGYTITGLWAIAGLYMFITFAIFFRDPEKNLLWINHNDETSVALARPVTAEGKRIMTATKLKTNYLYEFRIKRAVKNYQAILLVLLGMYYSVVTFQISIEDVSLGFLVIYPSVGLFVVWLTLIPGTEINLKALFRLRYMLFMIIIPGGVYILFDITDDKWMGVTMCAGSFLAAGVLSYAVSFKKTRRRYTFPSSLKVKKINDSESEPE